MLIILDSENLFKKDESVEDGSFKSTRDRNDTVNLFRVTCRKSEGAKTTDRWANDRMKFVNL